MKRLACVALALCACSSSNSTDEGPQADEYIVDCTGTDAGTGVTSDENFAAFINAEASNKVLSNNRCSSPELTSPAQLSAQTPPDIVFNDVPATGCAAAPIRPRTGLRKIPRQQPAI